MLQWKMEDVASVMVSNSPAIKNHSILNILSITLILTGTWEGLEPGPADTMYAQDHLVYYQPLDFSKSQKWSPNWLKLKHFVPKLKDVHWTVSSNNFNHHPHNTVSPENLVFLSHLKSEHFGMQPGRNCELMHSGKAMYTQVAPGVTAAVTVTLSKLFTWLIVKLTSQDWKKF